MINDEGLVLASGLPDAKYRKTAQRKPATMISAGTPEEIARNVRFVTITTSVTPDKGYPVLASNYKRIGLTLVDGAGEALTRFDRSSAGSSDNMVFSDKDGKYYTIVLKPSATSSANAAAWTAAYESTVAILLMAMKDGIKLDKGIETLDDYKLASSTLQTAYEDHVSTGKLKISELGSALDERSFQSALKTARLLASTYQGRYEAWRGAGFMEDIYKKFKAVSGGSVLASAGADKWNPGDIWLTRAGYSPSKVMESKTLQTLNEALADALKAGDIIPVSLKVTDSPKLKLVSSSEFDHVTDVVGVSWKGKATDTLFGNMTLPVHVKTSSGKVMIEQYRGRNKVPSVELGDTGNRNARYGNIGLKNIAAITDHLFGSYLDMNRAWTDIKALKTADDIKAFLSSHMKVDGRIPELDNLKDDEVQTNIQGMREKAGLIYLIFKAQSLGKLKFVQFLNEVLKFAGSKLDESSDYMLVH